MQFAMIRTVIHQWAKAEQTRIEKEHLRYQRCSFVAWEELVRPFITCTLFICLFRHFFERIRLGTRITGNRRVIPHRIILRVFLGHNSSLQSSRSFEALHHASLIVSSKNYKIFKNRLEKLRVMRSVYCCGSPRGATAFYFAFPFFKSFDLGEEHYYFESGFKKQYSLIAPNNSLVQLEYY